MSAVGQGVREGLLSKAGSVGVSEQGSPSPWPVGGLSFLLRGDSGLTVSFTRRVLLPPEERLTEASTAS